MRPSTDNGVDFELREITPINKFKVISADEFKKTMAAKMKSKEYAETIKYFHTDIKGSVVLPKEFHAWLFVGTQKEYDNKINILESMNQDGKVIGTFSYNNFEDWNKKYGRPVGNSKEKENN